MKTDAFFHKCSAVVFLPLALLLAPLGSARADILELTNGDHYRGKVISMTESNLEFLSEIQGRVKLPREKIAQITFREVVKPAAAAPTAAPLILSGPPTSPPAADPLNNPGGSVAQQMQKQGVDPRLISQIQDQIFGKGSPEAVKKFNEMMGGLMAGSVSVQDVQAMAQDSINQIKQAKKDLGGDAGEMLDGYLDILQKFVNEAATDNTIASSTNSAPAAFSATARVK